MKIILFILCIIALDACDPMRRIYMENTSDEEAWITYIIKEDSLKSSPLFISNNPEVKFCLKHPPYNIINMSFGIGNWDEQSLKNFVDDLEVLELKWNSGNIKMTNTDSIQSFLIDHRTGFDNRVIKIRFSDPKTPKTQVFLPR